MVLKLDMSKAYDRMKWPFIKAVLLKMGFPRRWVNGVRMCLTSAIFCINQWTGDTISPYIFIMCDEVLSYSLINAGQQKVMHGVPIGRQGVRISHLLFADNSLIFCKASVREWWGVHTLLQQYKKALGQKLNRDNTALYFSKNTQTEAKTYLSNVIAVPTVQCYRKYLGCGHPVMIGRGKSRSFHYILDSVW